MNPRLLGPTPIENSSALGSISMSSEAKALLMSARAPADFLRLLIERERFVDAVRVFPYVVAVQKAVWWACLCSWHGANETPAPGEDEAFAAVIRWLQAPSESNYEAAVAIASKDVLTTPAEYCTRAIAWAGFMTSPDGPWQTVGPLAAASTAAGCAFLALSQAGKNGVAADAKQLIRLGLAVEDGILAWDDDATKGTSK